MNPDIQSLILRNLISNDVYMRKVIPFLKREYFEGPFKTVFNEIISFVGKYNNLPTFESLSIEMQNSDISDQQLTESGKVLSNITSVEKDADVDWLLESTEKWCQDRSIYLAIIESISIIDGKHENLSKDALPDLLQKALAVGFDTNIGHDYFGAVDDRYEFYHTTEERMPFDLEKFNSITKGGLPKKSLSVVMAGTGTGKSLFMCHVAAAALSAGQNVLYITMEMSEERIAERIDANLMNVSIDKIETLSKESFTNKMTNISKKTDGNLIIKEYPTGSAHAGHFRALIAELSLKKKFKPDIIMIDYINICSSSRIKNGLGGSVNTYSLIKSIAEELRGLSVENNVPILTATQTTRSGFSNTDIGLEDTSESFGLPATADLMFALVSNEELQSLNQVMVKQLKNRYSDINDNKRFILGIDRAKMKLYDVEESAQGLMTGETPMPNSSSNAFGKRENNFEGFKQ